MRKKGKIKMDKAKHMNIPECKVLVRKLTLEEISRMIISPFFISNKCGHCQQFAQYGPKCTTCSMSYHYECAIQRGICCELPILFQENPSPQSCSKCSQNVDFGPSCVICSSKFHSHCLNPTDHCCNFSLCRALPQRPCGHCRLTVDIGVRCPFCAKIFHPQCVEENFCCCNNKLIFNDSNKYNCKRCHKGVSSGCAMCLLCGDMYHFWCLTKLKGIGKCCGKPVSLEIFFIPSFKFTIRYFKQFSNRLAQLKRMEEMAISHGPMLRDMIRKTHMRERTKKKSTSCQTSALDRIEIISVKTEAEELPIEIPSSPSPPILQRETSSSPEPSSSSRKPDSSMEGDDSLKNLFEFLFNTVKKFPPQLQTQVKVNLFKIVTEAEMKMHCDMEENIIECSRI